MRITSVKLGTWWPLNGRGNGLNRNVISFTWWNRFWRSGKVHDTGSVLRGRPVSIANWAHTSHSQSPAPWRGDPHLQGLQRTLDIFTCSSNLSKISVPSSQSVFKHFNTVHSNTSGVFNGRRALRCIWKCFYIFKAHRPSTLIVAAIAVTVFSGL